MDKKIFDRLTAYIVENQNRFYRLAYSYVRNLEDALDAVQSAVCRALEYGGGLQNGEAVKTWFYRILVNECLRMIKERERFPEAREEEEIPYEEKVSSQLTTWILFLAVWIRIPARLSNCAFLKK